MMYLFTQCKPKTFPWLSRINATLIAYKDPEPSNIETRRDIFEVESAYIRTQIPKPFRQSSLYFNCSPKQLIHHRERALRVRLSAFYIVRWRVSSKPRGRHSSHYTIFTAHSCCLHKPASECEWMLRSKISNWLEIRSGPISNPPPTDHQITHTEKTKLSTL